jgi:hypothetical protein
MNKDFRVLVTLPVHPKTKKLMRQLGDRSFYNLIRLWAWVAQNKPEGVLANMEKEDIEIACDWKGDEGLFVDTLIDLKLIDCKDGVCEIHDWEDNNGFAFGAAQRVAKAKKAAKARWVSEDDTKATRAERMKAAREKANHNEDEWLEMKEFFGTCVKCEGESALIQVDRDHIVPVYQGGCHGIKNIQPLCAQCNAGKGPDTTDWREVYCLKNNIQMPEIWKKTNCDNTECCLHNHCTKQASSSDQSDLTSTPSPSPSPNKLFRYSRKTKLPSKIFLTDDMKDYFDSKRATGSVDDVFEAFVVHHGAKGSAFQDWHRAWQKWVRNHVEWHGQEKKIVGVSL